MSAPIVLLKPAAQGQLSCAPRERDAFDSDFPAERVGIEETQSANHLD
jgi:hypothetical protein